MSNTMNPNQLAPMPTGNYLVTMRPKMRTSAAVKSLSSVSSEMKVQSFSDSKSESSKVAAMLGDQGCVYFDHLKVAVIQSKDSEFVSSMSSALAGNDDVVSVRPEFYMFTSSNVEQRYQQWVQEGIRILAEGAPFMRVPVSDLAARVAQNVTSDDATWGINATGVSTSSYTGKGIKIAVLDTGFDLGHPDFAGRTIIAESFVPGESAQDGHGHGTHCIGTAAGPLATAAHPRYGCAVDAEIFAAKVLSNSGSGQESWVLAGMNWAIDSGCDVISMSLGRPVQPGEQPDPLYEQVGQLALENGSIIIAAAGNESARQFNHIAPVGSPANSKTIMAVGSVDDQMRVSRFSCGGINGSGGEVNLCAPGEDILSSFPLPETYRRLAGTSMATPHVSGIAAMFAQSDAKLRGVELWETLRRNALDIGLPIRDGGAGFVQAPSVSSPKTLAS
ncbi:hypothetical protein Q669_01410 [Labrenzia sp. C1B10]|uniref:S8 family serine peptidase n=1 Tax=unclassified Labrenzia TaxID=2648686 RepID=UPI0003B8AB4D|nr:MULTISPECIES: S8 family serine peptidase [unclassified Labrenzia]ERP93527.1 hypothetical protein Q669_01410 [Labrenzia sp. C1B10]ERS05648.1 hypothetical protein Q675_04515 [Labrenzia sp. C1B70]